jgi:hypothetical protein
MWGRRGTCLTRTRPHDARCGAHRDRTHPDVVDEGHPRGGFARRSRFSRHASRVHCLRCRGEPVQRHGRTLAERIRTPDRRSQRGRAGAASFAGRDARTDRRGAARGRARLAGHPARAWRSTGSRAGLPQCGARAGVAEHARGSAAPDELVGAILPGRFRIDGFLARGGFWRVTRM